MSACNHGASSHSRPMKEKFSVTATADVLGLEVFGKNIHCLFPEDHYEGIDRNPSCVLYEERFKCFSCGSHGDAIDLVKKVLGFSFLEAKSYLEANTTFASSSPAKPLPVSGLGLPDSTQSVLTYLFQLASLPTSENLGGQYLSSRKLSPELCGSLGVRYLEDPFKAWAALCGEFSLSDLKVAGLINSAGVFHFQEHPLLFFFLHNRVPIYLCGRSLEANPKIKELKPVGLSCPAPYQIDVLLTKPAELFICEGLIDTLSAAQLGMPAIGAPGANSFPEHWLRFIPKTTRIHVLFDRDRAGEDAAIELRSQFRRSGFKADALVVPIGKDVNDFLFERMV